MHIGKSNTGTGGTPTQKPPETKADERYAELAASARYLPTDIPQKDSELEAELAAVEALLNRTRDEMKSAYDVAPKVRRYFELKDKDAPNGDLYVHDYSTGGEILESERIRCGFDQVEMEIFTEVAQLRYPLSKFEDRYKLLSYEAWRRGIRLPGAAPQSISASEVGLPIKGRKSFERAKDVAKVRGELEILQQEIYGTEDYAKALKDHPDFLTFEVTEKMKAKKEGLIKLGGYRPRQEFVYMIVGVIHGKAPSTVESDWKTHRKRISQLANPSF